MARLGRMLQDMDRRAMPVHVTPVARMMVDGLKSSLPFPTGQVLGQLLNPRLTKGILRVMGTRGQVFDPLFHHTVNATMVQGGEKVNVLPSEIVVDMDGRLLPGFGPEDMLAEVRQIIGPDVELEVSRYDAGPADPDMGLFPLLSDILRAADPPRRRYPCCCQEPPMGGCSPGWESKPTVSCPCLCPLASTLSRPFMAAMSGYR